MKLIKKNVIFKTKKPMALKGHKLRYYIKLVKSFFYDRDKFSSTEYSAKYVIVEFLLLFSYNILFLCYYFIFNLIFQFF